MYFRSVADYQRYNSLHLQGRPFLLTELAEESQGYAPLTNTRDHLNDGNDLGHHKLDILYLSPTPETISTMGMTSVTTSRTYVTAPTSPTSRAP